MKVEHGYILAGTSALTICLAIAAVVFYITGYQLAGSGAGHTIRIDNVPAAISRPEAGAFPANKDAFSGIENDVAPQTADPGDPGNIRQDLPKTTPIGRYVKDLGEALSRE